MKPIINLDDPAVKTYGRRQPPTVPLAVTRGRKQDMVAWRKYFPTPFVPKGVYRFHTHEEADQWLLKMLTRQRAS